MDWNGDGNHDWQDDAFYNNVLSDNSDNASHSSTSSTPSPLRFVLVAALIIYILVKIFN